jgi:predicted DNA-binding helix-hairpin-helix protein
VSIAKLRPFIVTEDWRPVALSDKFDLRSIVAPRVEQMELFAARCSDAHRDFTSTR